MHPLLRDALDETAALEAERGWQRPDEATLSEAQHVLSLVHPRWRAPQVEVQADGSVTFDWQSGDRGWVQMSVRGRGRLVHEGVIDGDDYEQDEAFAADAAELPAWAGEVLGRLLGREQ